MTAPRIGPSNVPRPPTSVMKIMYAVHCTLKYVLGWKLINVESVSAPAAAQPTAARTKIRRFVAMTRTPSEAAASSLSRIA